MNCAICNGCMMQANEAQETVYACPYGCHRLAMASDGGQVESFGIRVLGRALWVENHTSYQAAHKRKAPVRQLYSLVRAGYSLGPVLGRLEELVSVGASTLPEVIMAQLRPVVVFSWQAGEPLTYEYEESPDGYT